MDNGTYEPTLNVIYEHVRGWVHDKNKPDTPAYRTIVGCMAGALIDYHGLPVVHIGVSARNLDDEVDKAIGRKIALERALDVGLTYKIHISNCNVPWMLWDKSIKDFAMRCFKHFHQPILFPKGIEYTNFPNRWDKKLVKKAIKAVDEGFIGD